MSSAIYVAVTKKESNEKDRSRPAEDISLEEGLLASQEEDHFVIGDADEKSAADDERRVDRSTNASPAPILTLNAIVGDKMTDGASSKAP
ncbi:hypothetical protein EIP86_007064 [Pleurotus ostreatoroseus]|nr:hypothetical protein EIP86_007064 [Pleurotus ostreatoroseus]